MSLQDGCCSYVNCHRGCLSCSISNTMELNREDVRRIRDLPEIEELLFFKVAHCTAVRALHIVCHNLQVGLHVDGGAGNQQQVAAELAGIRLLCFLLHPHTPIKHPSASTRCHNTPAQQGSKHELASVMCPRSCGLNHETLPIVPDKC